MEYFVYLNIFCLWIIALVSLYFGLKTHVTLRGILNGGAATRTKIGSELPAFRALTLSGESVTQEDFVTHKSLFVFFSPDCEVCLGALPTHVEVGKNVEDAGAKFAIVSVSDELLTKKLFNKSDYDVQVMLAPKDTNQMMKDLGVLGTPAFVYAEHGRIAQSGYPSTKDPQWVQALERINPLPLKPEVLESHA